MALRYAHAHSTPLSLALRVAQDRLCGSKELLFCSDLTYGTSELVP